MRTLGPTSLALLALACGAPAPPPPDPAPAESTASTAPETDPGPPEGSAVGQRAPDFILPTSDGGGWNLAEHRGQPVVLVFFRGTW